MAYRLLLLVALLLVPISLVAVTPPQDAAPKMADGTDAAKKQIAGFRTPTGMKVELFASEPLLASPVAIGLDEKGRVFVAEEHRFNAGTQENRSSAFLLEDDLQIRTVEDRLKMFQKHEKQFKGGMSFFTKNADQLRVVEDTTGTGKADKSKILAQFNGPLDGLAAGVLATNGDVYFTCIPNLWVLKKGTDTPESLLTGFGVNAAFLGHDLHGLCWGPDGKLYFSVGDRGFHVKSKEGPTYSGPRTGAVFRCNPDGTEFEVVHRGLRNPQELAFDQYGNLFADDNNCDKGDHARLVYVVDGGESGWNMAYQSISPHTSAPWFSERLWHLQHVGQPAYIVPPVGKIGTGPSGFLFTSGTSLADRYKNSFLMCNFTGNGGLESFRVKPVGAGFEIEDYHDFFKPIMATDAEFGYDGKLYISDFVNLDWSGKSLGGRIYTLFDPKKIESPVVKETKTLFAEGFEKRDTDELIALLGHADQRARQRAQFELMNRIKNKDTKIAANAAAKLTSTALDSKNQLARIHAIWAHLPILKSLPSAYVLLDKLQQEPDPEVQAQYAKISGDANVIDAIPSLLKLLDNANARVKFFAAQSLGKLKAKAAQEPLFALLKKNADADTYLRHACVTALVRIGDADAVAAKTSDDSAAVRLAVVLVQRQLKDKRIAAALNDADTFVSSEAARAIHDLPMLELYPQLAALLPKLGEKPISDGDAIARRSISAAFTLGTADHAKAVLAVITNIHFSNVVRAEALAAIVEWGNPPPRDRVTGFWRVIPKRDDTAVRAVVEANLSDLLAKTNGELQKAVIGTILKLGVKADESQFVAWANDTKKEPNLRVAAMRLLVNQKSKSIDAILAQALTDTSAIVRAEARERIALTDAKRGTKLFAEALASDTTTIAERQRVFALLPKIKNEEAGKLLDAWAMKLSAGVVNPGLKLDLMEALKASPSPLRNKEYSQYIANQPKDQRDLWRWNESLSGGNAEQGREVFYNHASAQCVRCHNVGGSGGVAGPELTRVADKYKENYREHFLESMILPSAKIAEGFATVTLTLIDGRVVAGTVLKDDKKNVTIKDPNGKTITVPTEDIESRTIPNSAMPSVVNTLTPREVRDLVEYLTTLK